MSLYATIRTSVSCPDCGRARTNDWQFYFGAVGDLPRYQLGDAIRWESAPQHGSQALTDVVAVAYSVEEPFCDRCAHPSALAEIAIRNGQVEEIQFLSFEPHRREVFLAGLKRVSFVIGPNGDATSLGSIT